MGGIFLFTTLGSLGDLHPYIAVGIGLRERGHTVMIASSEIYRAKVEGEGLLFRPLHPNLPDITSDAEIWRRIMHPRTGPEFIVRKLIMPWLEQSFEDTVAAAREADVLVGHVIAFATPMVAEHLKKPWMSIALQPSIFLSRLDPPVIAGAPFLSPLNRLIPGFAHLFFRFARGVMRNWGDPINEIRARLGLRPFLNPVLDDMFSPWGTQAWFSRLLAQPQADWPARTVVTGFPFYDKLEPGQGLSTELAEFLDAGPAPVVFTLGSTAVFDAGTFYNESLSAVRKAGRRAVLLVGQDSGNKPAGPVPDNVFVAEYAPYSELLPRAAATVHQGGIGTTAQALRSARPMIVVPYCNEQPDNGARVRRLGVGRVIPRGKYRAERVAKELKILLAEEDYSKAATQVGREMAAEDGVRTACEGLEALIEQRPTAQRC